MEVGDKVLVMPALGENMAVPLGDLSEGDRVLLYNLKDSTRIAVPTLSLNVGDRVFSSPSFDFAGFNWEVDFNFMLIPFISPNLIENPHRVIEPFYRPVKYQGEIVTAVSHHFTWNGFGGVYLSKSDIALINQEWDDSIRITGPKGTTGWIEGSPGSWHSALIEISSILNIGTNKVTVEIKDIYGLSIGFGGWDQKPGWIIQII